MDGTFSAAHLHPNAENAARLLKSMANANRLVILCSLAGGEKSVSEINDAVDLSQSALSQHLAILRKHNIVATRRHAQTVYYRLDDQTAEAILQLLYKRFCSEGETFERTTA